MAAVEVSESPDSARRTELEISPAKVSQGSTASVIVSRRWFPAGALSLIDLNRTQQTVTPTVSGHGEASRARFTDCDLMARTAVGIMFEVAVL